MARAKSKAGGKRGAGRKKAASKRGGRKTGTSARSTRTTARKTSRASGARGRKSRTSQTSGAPGSGAASTGGQVEGEGSYTASRHFRKAQTDFVRRNRGRIGKMGKDAEAALEGSQGAELREAEDEARSHAAAEE